MSYLIEQASTSRPLVFLMVDATDHVTGKTGLSPTVTIRKVGGSFASPAGAVTEIAHGWYQVAGNATDSDTLGPLLLHATGSGADPCDEVYDVVNLDPITLTNLATGGHTFRNAYADGSIEVAENANYSNTNIAAIQIPRDGGDWPDDLVGYTLLFTGTMVASYVAAGGTSLGTGTFSASTITSYTGTGTNTVLVVRPGTPITTILCPSLPLAGGSFPNPGSPYPYKGQIWASSGANVHLLWSGPIKVVDDVRD